MKARKLLCWWHHHSCTPAEQKAQLGKGTASEKVCLRGPSGCHRQRPVLAQMRCVDILFLTRDSSQSCQVTQTDSYQLRQFKSDSAHEDILLVRANTAAPKLRSQAQRSLLLAAALVAALRVAALGVAAFCWRDKGCPL